MKRNPASWPTDMALDDDLAGAGDRAHQRAAVLHAAQQMGLAAVDEALGQDAMERVGELVLDGAGALLPMRRDRPASRRDARYRSRCGYGRCAPSAYRCRPRRGRGARHGPPPSRWAAAPPATVRWRKIWPSSRAWASLITLRKSGIWQTSQSRRTVAGPPTRRRISGSWPSCGQRLLVVRLARPDQDRVGRARAPGCASRRLDGMEIEIAVAPHQRRRWHRSGGSRWPPPSRAPAGPISAVVPKLPSFIWRPARPAIWASSAGAQAPRRRGRRTCSGPRRRHGPGPC